MQPGWLSTATCAVPAATSQRADTTRNKTIAAPPAADECRIRQGSVGPVADWCGELGGSCIAPLLAYGTPDANTGEVTAVAVEVVAGCVCVISGWRRRSVGYGGVRPRQGGDRWGGRARPRRAPAGGTWGAW